VLSAGTANGVTYLNGSKVVTSGSALTFDGNGLNVTKTTATFGVPVYQFNTGSINGIFTGDTTVGAVSLGSYSNHPVAFYTNNTERMRLDASGNLGLGVTSPIGVSGYQGITIGGSTGALIRLQSGASTQNAQIAANSSGLEIECVNTGIPIKFYTGGSERARITSGGEFLVGVTSFNSSVNANFFLYGGGSSYIGHVSGTSSGANYVNFAYNGGSIGSITQSGTTAVLYNVTSDQRLKENIVDAPEFGSVIDSIKVRSYDWITDKTHQRAGFIAQELVQVAPEAVHQPEDTEQMMAVDYSKLVPMLVKEVQSLRQRIAQLESN